MSLLITATLTRYRISAIVLYMQTYVSFEKEPYKRDYILQKKPAIVLAFTCRCTAHRY